MVKEFLNNYFGFNRQQRNGLVVLMCISAFLLIVRVTYPSFMKPGDIEIMNLPVVNADSLSAEKKEISATLFYFDPNTISKEELIKLGLKEKTAGTVIKFRKKNPFKAAEDLEKVFGISPSLLAKLRPYVRIGSSPKTGHDEFQSKEKVIPPAQVK